MATKGTPPVPRITLDEFLNRLATGAQKVEEAANRYAPAASAAELAKARLEQGVCLTCGGERLGPSPTCAACSRTVGVRLLDLGLGFLTKKYGKKKE